MAQPRQSLLACLVAHHICTMFCTMLVLHSRKTRLKRSIVCKRHRANTKRHHICAVLVCLTIGQQYLLDFIVLQPLSSKNDYQWAVMALKLLCCRRSLIPPLSSCSRL